MANETVKLSELARNTTLVNDQRNIIAAGRLIDEITHLGEHDHLDRKWVVAEKVEIGCSAEEMIEKHIEDVICDAGIEDGEDLQKQILKVLKPCIPDVQAMLDEALKNVNTTYWLGTNQKVEIDVEIGIDRQPAEIGKEG